MFGARQGVCSCLMLSCLAAAQLADERALAAEPPTDSREVLAAHADPRRPHDHADLQRWLAIMQAHRFSLEEMTAATGLPADTLNKELQEERAPTDIFPPVDLVRPLRVLPYPGGRHPRIGFLDGALRPQRETKLSVFCPWPDGGYVVVDLPEALWSNLGLTYLAHTHVPTIWSRQGTELQKQEWQIDHGEFRLTRRLPNGIEYQARAKVVESGLRMSLRLTNGTPEPLSDLRVQNCVMLKAAAGFAQQTNDNKLLRAPYGAAHDESRRRWIITAWTPNHRTWGNAPCPCLHSDPKFPDCPAGESREIQGWLGFYEGDDIHAELARIEATRWDQRPLP